MLRQALRQGVEMERSVGRGDVEAGGEPEGEGLLVGVEFIDEALPIEPDVELGVARVVEDLEARLGVGREVQLGVVERLDEAVVGAAVEVAQDDVHLRREGGAGAEEGQQMDVVARRFAAPDRDVVIGKGGVSVGPPEPKCVQTGLDRHPLRRPIGSPDLEPKAGQGVPLGGQGGALHIAEEAEVVELERESVQVVRRACGVGREDLFVDLGPDGRRDDRQQQDQPGGWAQDV